MAESGHPKCRVCGSEIPSPSDIGWECEDCGIAVCRSSDCFDEAFKHVAGGEATRCLFCGHLS